MREHGGPWSFTYPTAPRLKRLPPRFARTHRDRRHHPRRRSDDDYASHCTVVIESRLANPLTMPRTMTGTSITFTTPIVKVVTRSMDRRGNQNEVISHHD